MEPWRQILRLDTLPRLDIGALYSLADALAHAGHLVFRQEVVQHIEQREAAELRDHVETSCGLRVGGLE